MRENFIFSLLLFCLGGAISVVRGQQTAPFNDAVPVSISLEYMEYPVNHSTWSIHELLPQSEVKISVISPPSDLRFYIFQAHSHLHNISLSYNNSIIPHYHVNGTNLGLIWQTKDGQGKFYVTNENPENVTVMFAVVAYGIYSPIPGGCNMEFEVESAPYLKIWSNNAVISVNAQPGSATGKPCSKDVLSHAFYRLYMPERDFSAESYFNAIKSMLTPEDILSNGDLAPVPIAGSVMRRLYSLYAGTGSVYAVLAHTWTGGTAAYVPAVTYGCSAIYFTDSCTVLTTTYSKVLCACVLFLGFFVCFYGHEFFRTQILLAGSMSGSLLAYIGLMQLTDLAFDLSVTLALGMGIVVGFVCLMSWWYFGIPAAAILLLSIPLGFLTASLTFFYGLGDLQFAQMDLDFWLSFVLIMLSVTLLLFPLLHHASIASSAIVGAYAAVVPLDHYVGGNLKYIVINSLRRAASPGFAYAVIQPPFQSADGLLLALWCVLAVVGLRVQQVRQAGRPPFPPASRYSPPPILPLPRGGSPNARTPIRVASRIPHSYGSIGDDDVFETPPPAPSSAPPGSLTDKFSSWAMRGLGLRGR